MHDFESQHYFTVDSKNACWAYLGLCTEVKGEAIARHLLDQGAVWANSGREVAEQCLLHEDRQKKDI